MQARKNEWPLDKVVVATEVTKKTVEEVDQGSTEDLTLTPNPDSNSNSNSRSTATLTLTLT